ncbi:MAG: ABC transporter ATP-binding protein [Clostridia bacterium]|nr:ABC transporter ATP-binding protein [Clostridia bacterium]
MKRNIFSLLKGNYIKYTIIQIFVAVAAFLGLLNPVFTRTIVDDIITDGKKQLLLPVLGCMLLATVLRLGIRYICQMNLEKITQKIVLNLRRQTFRKLMELDFSYFDRHGAGEMMTQMTTDIDITRQFLAHCIYVSLENITLFFGSLLILIFYIDAKLSSMLFFVMPVVVILTVSLAKEQKEKYRRLRQVHADLNTVVGENIWAQRVVKAFVREEYENNRMAKVNEAFRQGQIDISNTSRKYLPFIQNIHGIIQLYLVVVGGIFVMKGIITLGELVMFNSMIWMITGPLSGAGFLINEAISGFASYEKLMDLMEAKPKIIDKNRSRKLETIKGKVEFKNVSLRYQNSQALRDVSFVAEQGTSVGIIGQTGSGKSSLIHLLGRFYDPDSGAVFLDDHYIKDIDLEVIRNAVATSQQEVFLFSDTVSANIAYGCPKATAEEIRQAAKYAMADEFIQKLPEGYDTVIGERGVTLSGGQKQRLALARAILKQPSVLVLDDTTSALDSETEKEIQKKLREICQDKTLFIISQKISSVKDCDQILVLQDGAVIQKGTHEELLAEEGGYYQSVYKHQYGGVING